MIAASISEEHLQNLSPNRNLPGGEFSHVKESFDVSNNDLGFGADGPICGYYYCQCSNKILHMSNIASSNGSQICRQTYILC